jgi:hypothetical protein
MSKPFNTKSMFDAIKQSLTSDKETGGGNGLYKEILKFTPGSTCQVRLVPNPNSPKETIFHYYNHAWTSNSTGKFVTALCPTTFGESCPIDAYYLKTYRTGTESEKKAASVLSRKEGWFVNVYVISDPGNPENEGKVKILRYGKELAKVIQGALEGDDVAEFGVERVFDVNEGCTLRIKCENRAGDRRGGKQYITYASSKFLPPSNLGLDETKLQDIYNSVHDLKAINKQTTPADMQRLLDEHFFNLSTGSPVEEDNSEDSNDGAPWNEPSNTKASSASSNNEDETDESTDEKLKKLLADL